MFLCSQCSSDKSNWSERRKTQYKDFLAWPKRLVDSYEVCRVFLITSCHSPPFGGGEQGCRSVLVNIRREHLEAQCCYLPWCSAGNDWVSVQRAPFISKLSVSPSPLHHICEAVGNDPVGWLPSHFLSSSSSFLSSLLLHFISLSVCLWLSVTSSLLILGVSVLLFISQGCLWR